MGRKTKKVYQYDMNMELVESFDSAYIAAKITGFNQSGICMSANGKRKSYKGFIWKFEKANKQGRDSKGRFISNK